MKKKILLTSILSLGCCLSLITGATFALFTSESKVNIAINSGKVEIAAAIDEASIEKSHVEPNAENNGYDKVTGNFYGGVAEVVGNALTLDKMVPGDEISFNIQITNASTVVSKYQTVVGVTEDGGLFGGLEVTVDSKSFNGITAKSLWKEAPAVSEATLIDTVAVTISLPLDAGDEYQNKSASLYVAVNAVQGNALCTDVQEKTVELYTAQDMALFSASVNAGNSYQGYTVKQMENIDLANKAFTPIGKESAPFVGTFDGNGYTLSNLKIDDKTGTEYTGLFGIIKSPAALTAIKVENADVKGKYSVGVIAGGYTGTISDCHVSGSIKVEGNYKVGGIVGYAYTKVNDCSVKGAAGSYVKAVYAGNDFEGDNVGGAIGYGAEGQKTYTVTVSGLTVEGTRKVGGAVGYLGGEVALDATVSECIVKITNEAKDDYTANNIGKLYVGGMVGEYAGDCGTVAGSVNNTTIEAVVKDNAGEIAGGNRSGIALGEKNTATASGITVNYLLSDLAFNGAALTAVTAYDADGLLLVNKLSDKKIISHKEADGPAVITIANDIDMAGKEWKALFAHWVNVEGGGHTIANLTTVADDAGRSGFAGYAGACTISDLTLKNVTATGYQVGAFVGQGEGTTIRNCSLEGANTVTWETFFRKDGTEKTSGAIGALIGIARNDVYDITLTAGATLTVDGRNYKTSLTGDESQQPYIGFILSGTPECTFTNNGTIDSTVAVSGGFNKVMQNKTFVEYSVTDINGFKYFRDSVNGGRADYKALTIALAADIDLMNEEWTPIGNSAYKFLGVFDGRDKTISNLKITKSSTDGIGLFGFTSEGTIKNFTLRNAAIKGDLYVGAIAGSPYTTVFSEIRLTGNIKVEGRSYVGGMLGYHSYGNLTGLTIEAESGSYVKAESEGARSYVGGIVGHRGEGASIVKDVTSNIDVIGSTCDVGGISGIAHYNNVFENVTCSGNVTLVGADDAGDELEIGGIAGVWHNQNDTTVTFRNCSFTGTLKSANKTTGAVTEFPNNGLVGRQYLSNGTGKLVIE